VRVDSGLSVLQGIEGAVVIDTPITGVAIVVVMWSFCAFLFGKKIIVYHHNIDKTSRIQLYSRLCSQSRKDCEPRRVQTLEDF
jgi:hypothetical protein